MNAPNLKHCSLCTHFHRTSMDLKEPGQCRESAPVPIMVGMAQNGTPAVMGYHPPVGPGHTCSKWRASLVTAEGDKVEARVN